MPEYGKMIGQITMAYQGYLRTGNQRLDDGVRRLQVSVRHEHVVEIQAVASPPVDARVYCVGVPNGRGDQASRTCSMLAYSPASYLSTFRSPAMNTGSVPESPLSSMNDLIMPS